MSSARSTADEARRAHGQDPVGAGNIQSVARGLSILELFSDRRPALSVSDIAVLTGLNRATCYRFCQTLRGLGYLEDVGQHRFRPGLKAVSLAHAALKSRELPELALPYLRELRAETGQTVNLALLDEADVVYVARVLSDHLMSLRLYVGSRLPAYASSLGRAMLAFLPEDEAASILEESDLVALTENTIVDRRRLLAELRHIREQGYAVNDQEIAIGLRGIAAPIMAASDRPIAAVNVSVADLTLGVHETEAAFAPKVLKATDAISALVHQLSID